MTPNDPLGDRMIREFKLPVLTFYLAQAVQALWNAEDWDPSLVNGLYWDLKVSLQDIVWAPLQDHPWGES